MIGLTDTIFLRLAHQTRKSWDMVLISYTWWAYLARQYDFDDGQRDICTKFKDCDSL